MFMSRKSRCSGFARPCRGARGDEQPVDGLGALVDGVSLVGAPGHGGFLRGVTLGFGVLLVVQPRGFHQRTCSTDLVGRLAQFLQNVMLRTNSDTVVCVPPIAVFSTKRLSIRCAMPKPMAAKMLAK